jgi:photosystem II stability/assembly factor-like uncharacterized protein
MEKEITLPGKEAYDVYMVIRQNGLWSAPLKIKIDTKFTGRFVGGDFDAIYWSSDGGETWIAGRGPNGTMLTLGDKNQDGVEDYLRVQDMAYGNGILVAVLGTPGNGLLPTVRSTVVLYSDDGGETWNQASLPDNGAILNMVVYGAGKFVALPLLDSRYVYYSTNGKTWSRTLGMPSTMTNIRWKSLVFGNCMFVALPYCQENPNHYYINPDTYSMNITIIPYLAYSTNGTSWSAVSMPVTPATIGGTLAYADGGFLLNIEDEGYWSTDATNWQLQSTSKKPPSYLVSWKNIFARTIMSSGTTMQISKDKGISWEAATTPTNFGGYGAAYEKSSNGTEGRIILTWTSTYVWSDDSGVTWTQAESPPSLPLHGSTGPIIFRGFTYITP